MGHNQCNVKRFLKPLHSSCCVLTPLATRLRGHQEIVSPVAIGVVQAQAPTIHAEVIGEDILRDT